MEMTDDELHRTLRRFAPVASLVGADLADLHVDDGVDGGPCSSWKPCCAGSITPSRSSPRPS
jgi:hypothetical protein